MKTNKKSISVEKENGRFYTPDYMVCNILDMAEYKGEGILKKHVIDNSCGDGAFLAEITRRYYCEAKKANFTSEEIKNDLENYIHGIEIEKVERDKCIDRLNRFFSERQIKEIKWDIICGDALTVEKYNGKMNYVFGNPPYVRVHNLGSSVDEIKSFSFAQSGMKDLYIVFYEIGIRMLSNNGVLGYITPSSFFNSLAGLCLRETLVSENLIDKICDLKHFRAFSATTYTTIAVLKKGRKNEKTLYYRFDEKEKKPYFLETLTASDYYIFKNFYFSKKEELKKLYDIYSNRKKSEICVKNGFATLCDDVFINDFKFSSKYIIPVVKASKGIKKTAFFPYTATGKLVEENEIKTDKNMYSYLKENEEKLLKRSNEKKNNWYAYGRSQAIKDTFRDKFSLNSIIRDEKDIKFSDAPIGTGVYGGLYILSDTVPAKKIKETLKTEEFANYVRLLGKYKSGGYYTFSSKDVKAYLDYKFAEKTEESFQNTILFRNTI